MNGPIEDAKNSEIRLDLSKALPLFLDSLASVWFDAVLMYVVM
jgi:hypothetical protein